MTDEEIFNSWKSEQYKDQSTEEKMEFVEHLHSFPRHFKKAFLAGLKAGRKTEREYVKNNAFTSMKEQGLFPFGKWHDLRKDPNDLPKEDCEIITLHENGNKNIQKWKNGNWTNAIVIPVIAWCEIPNFTDKE